MSYNRNQLKALIVEQRKILKEGGCGTASEHMPNGDTSSPAIQHPVDSSRGDVSGHDGDHGDHEGKMALSQLSQIMQNADALQSIVGLDDNLQAWVQSKLTKAADYLDTVKNYMEFETSPEQTVAISLGEQKINISREQLKRVTTEALLYEMMLDEGFGDKVGSFGRTFGAGAKAAGAALGQGLKNVATQGIGPGLESTFASAKANKPVASAVSAQKERESWTADDNPRAKKMGYTAKGMQPGTEGHGQYVSDVIASQTSGFGGGKARDRRKATKRLQDFRGGDAGYGLEAMAERRLRKGTDT